MRRYWWTVWIKVAVVALALFLGYRYVDRKIDDLISPYVLEEIDPSASSSSSEDRETTEQTEPTEKTETLEKPVWPGMPHRPGWTDPSDPSEEDVEPEEIDKKNLLEELLNKVQDTLGVKLDLENMLFDYANEYAQQMKEESDAERHPGAGN